MSSNIRVLKHNQTMHSTSHSNSDWSGSKIYNEQWYFSSKNLSKYVENLQPLVLVMICLSRQYLHPAFTTHARILSMQICVSIRANYSLPSTPCLTPLPHPALLISAPAVPWIKLRSWRSLSSLETSSWKCLNDGSAASEKCCRFSIALHNLR